MSTNKQLLNLRWVKHYACTLKGKRLPKGAVTGTDEHGLFACYNFAVQGKSGYYRGLPRLALWRYKRGHWTCAIEASTTTYAIVDFVSEYDTPKVDWGDGKWQLSTKSVRLYRAKGEKEYYNLSLPNGSFYGSDEHGVFVCTMPKIQGYYEGTPCVYISRPQPCQENRKNGTAWHTKKENGAVAFAIVEYTMREDYADAKEEYHANNGMYNAMENLVPYSYYREYSKNTDDYPRNTIGCVEFPNTLENIAARQREYGLELGYWK